MRIEYLHKLPHECYVACSGGADSMAVVDFLLRGKKGVTLLHFDHGTQHGQEAREFISTYAETNRIPLHVGRVRDSRSRQGRSLEEWWRDERYLFFSQFQDKPVITCHHLDDVVEWWVISSLRGEGKLIPYRRDNIIRPFLLTRKEALLSWCKRKGVPYIEDPSNEEEDCDRNFVRHTLLPQCLRINPGIHKTLAKKLKCSVLEANSPQPGG